MKILLAVFLMRPPVHIALNLGKMTIVMALESGRCRVRRAFLPRLPLLQIFMSNRHQIETQHNLPNGQESTAPDMHHNRLHRRFNLRQKTFSGDGLLFSVYNGHCCSSNPCASNYILGFLSSSLSIAPQIFQEMKSMRECVINSSPPFNQREKFLAGFLLCSETAKHARCDSNGARLLNPAHGHAKMPVREYQERAPHRSSHSSRCFHDDGNTSGFDGLLYRNRNLSG
jgi:hypothetical protein